MMTNEESYWRLNITLYPTQVFSVNNWALKPNQPEEPPFITHMLAICSTDKPVTFKAPKPSFNVERVPQGTKPGAKPGHKKHSTSSKQPSVSSKEATKGESSKAPTGSKSGHSKKRKDIFHYSSESASGNDALAASTAEANPGNSDPSDFVPQQQGMNEGSKNTSYYHLFAGTGLHVIAYQTKSISEGLKIALTQPITGKGDSSIARQIEEETFSTIKLEDLAKLVSRMQPSFKDLILSLLWMIVMKMRMMKFMLLKMLKLKILQFLNPHLPGLLKFKSLPTKSSFFSLKSTNWNLRRTKLKLKLLFLKLNPLFLIWNSLKSCWESP
ncbi:hypothetical protein Tco_1340265 [Tanacetum coccineum]